MPMEELSKMPKWVSIVVISLIILNVAEGRAISPDSNSHRPVHNPSHLTASSEHSRHNYDDGQYCKGVDRDECLVRKTMAAHTDYIYTQDTNGP